MLSVLSLNNSFNSIRESLYSFIFCSFKKDLFSKDIYLLYSLCNDVRGVHMLLLDDQLILLIRLSNNFLILDNFLY